MHTFTPGTSCHGTVCRDLTSRSFEVLLSSVATNCMCLCMCVCVCVCVYACVCMCACGLGDWGEVHAATGFYLQTRCNALQNSVLQRTATHCNALQHTATHCNTVLWKSLWEEVQRVSIFQHTVMHCNTLQHTLHCNALQHRALQHTATHSYESLY